MDTERYNLLQTFLQNQILPDTLTSQQQKQIKQQSKHFQLKNNFLYKIDKRNDKNLLRVIRRYEMEPVLYMFHNDPTAGHFSVDKMFEKIRDRYYWPQMYENIREYVKTCDACQRRGKSRRNELLHPIPVHSPFYQIGIDIVGPLPRTKDGNRYIITAIDYLTKWPEAKPVQEATAEQVAIFIYEDIICRHGCPTKILSDRGTHFKNQLIDYLVQKFEIKHLFSTPYHPQTNGLVERFNRTICESLAKLATYDTEEWDLYIAPTLFAYRTSKNATTKMTPFLLLYGREAKLPIDTMEEVDVTLKDRLQTIVDDLPQIRESTRQKVDLEQSKQKSRHDRHLRKEVQFSIGDKVLYYNAAMDKQWSGKLNPKWKGLYYIHQVLLNGSYKLRTIEGNVLRTPVNGNLLKMYFDRQHWEPQLVINTLNVE